MLESCARALAKAGARVQDVTLPPAFERVPDAHRSISSFEFVRNRAWEIDHHWDMISETLRKGRISHGLACSFDAYRSARAFAESCRLMMDDIFADYDVLLTPAAAGEAPVGLSSTGDASFCLIWTTMHVPAITLPLFTGPNGLPVGAQLVAKRGSDRKLFEAGQWVMNAMR
jgi:amidase